MRAVEITGTEDWHDVHGLYEWMETVHHGFTFWKSSSWEWSLLLSASSFMYLTVRGKSRGNQQAVIDSLFIWLSCHLILSSVLHSAGVQRLFLNKLIDVAVAWHQHFPKLPAAPSRFIYCSVHAIKNTRRKMEDKHLALAEFNHLFGIQVQDFHCLTLVFLSSCS